MPNVTVNVPQPLLDLYNARRATWNAANPTSPMPAPTVAALQRFVTRQMASYIIMESIRRDPGDGSIYDPDADAVGGFL